MSKYNQSDLTIGNTYYWFYSNLNVPQVRGKTACPLTYFLNKNGHASTYLFISSTNIYWAHAILDIAAPKMYVASRSRHQRACSQAGRLKQTQSPWRDGCSGC